VKGHAVVGNGAVKNGVVIVFAGVANWCYVCIMMFVQYLSETKQSALTWRHIPQLYRIYLLNSGNGCTVRNGE